jgi:hypothetical protein
MAALIHGPPEIVALRVDRDEYLVQMPFVTRPGASPPQCIGILLAELAALLPDGFVGHDDAADEQELFPIAMAERKTEVQPDGVADDLTRKPVVFVEIRRG